MKLPIVFKIKERTKPMLRDRHSDTQTARDRQIDGGNRRNRKVK